MTFIYGYVHNIIVKQKLFVSSLLIFLAILFPSPSFAHHRQRVLGVSTSSSEIQIPATVEGPGFILPDSPFFFLDKIKQNVRLTFAFTPEAKAKLYSDIAGERMAELRIMLVKNNANGVKNSLGSISDNLKKSAEELDNAKLSGRDISVLARTINQRIKTKQQVLDILEKQTNGELKNLVGVSQNSLLESKVKVEDSLTEEELENEVKDDLNRLIERKIEESSNSARELEESIDELHKEASLSATKELRKRKEAMKRAIEEKNEELRKAEERRLMEERKEQEKVLKLQEESAREVRKTVEEAKKAAEKFREVQRKAEKIETNSSELKKEEIKQEESSKKENKEERKEESKSSSSKEDKKENKD